MIDTETQIAKEHRREQTAVVEELQEHLETRTDRELSMGKGQIEKIKGNPQGLQRDKSKDPELARILQHRKKLSKILLLGTRGKKSKLVSSKGRKMDIKSSTIHHGMKNHLTNSKKCSSSSKRVN
jgi:hypothetical protein